MARPGRTKKRAAEEWARFDRSVALAVATIEAEARTAFSSVLAGRIHEARHISGTRLFREAGLIPELLACDECGHPYATTGATR